MKKIIILVLLGFLCLGAYSQKPEKVDSTLDKQVTVKYKIVTDTIKTVGILFVDNFLKREPIYVIMTGTYPVNLGQAKKFYNMTFIEIKPQDIFMYIELRDKQPVWITPW